MFHDRHDAGLRLAWELGHYKDRKDALVLAIPRGGMPVGAALARELDLPLNAILVGRLEHPDDRERQIGAVSLTEVEFAAGAVGAEPVTAEYVAAAVESVRAVLHRRYWNYRAVSRAPSVEGRVVILVDDEAACALSLTAAAKRLRRDGAARVLAAVPAATSEAVAALRRAADEVVCLRTAQTEQALSEFYRDFRRVSEDEALEALKREASADARR